jgi:hypothetical protein
MNRADISLIKTSFSDDSDIPPDVKSCCPSEIANEFHFDEVDEKVVLNCKPSIFRVNRNAVN